MKYNILGPDHDQLIKKAKEGLSKFFGLSEKGLTCIASCGWYLDGRISMGYTTNLMEKAISGDVKFLDKFFSEYYSENLELLADNITKRQNSRLRIVMEALECHKEEKFHASTILFLSQADGICNGQLFRTKKEKESLKKYLAKTESNSLNNILFGMITSESAIDTGYSKKENIENSLNRHSIVHGLDMNFGTKINSLKAFSLLSFVTDFVDRYKEL